MTIKKNASLFFRTISLGFILLALATVIGIYQVRDSDVKVMAATGFFASLGLISRYVSESFLKNRSIRIYGE